MKTPNENQAPLTRRRFLRAAALGAVAGPQFVSAADEKPAVPPSEKSFEEPAKSLSLVNDADVIVCGAGPAGIAAAITAARAGARTRRLNVDQLGPRYASASGGRAASGAWDRNIGSICSGLLSTVG